MNKQICPIHDFARPCPSCAIVALEAGAHKRQWRPPQLERLQVSVDTQNPNRGSGGDYGAEPEDIFGGG